jgi:CRISPR type III-A-associated protein Csm2
MEDEQSQTPSMETPAEAPAQEATSEGPSLAQALEIAKAKAEAESSKRDAAQQSRQNAALENRRGREPREARADRPPRSAGENRGENRGGGQGGPRREGGRPDRGSGAGRPEGRPGGGGGGRPFEGFAEIELEKLISDSLYLDNQAHAVVVRMRDMDSGTKSQLRRLYNAVRRAVRAPESERQHQFVMLRARLAYTIARHSLRSLDALERLLLQVTRRNDARGYERFKDLFEAIVAYNE